MRWFLAAAAALVALACGASAGVYSDDMGKCLVKSSSPEDQVMLVKWIFAAMSEHPAVKPMTKLTTDEREGYNRQAAALMQRLMTVDCRKETIAAMKNEGNSAIEAAFSLLGEVAMRGLMTDPQVQKGIEGLGKGLDEKAFKELTNEATGLPEAKTK